MRCIVLVGGSYFKIETLRPSVKRSKKGGRWYVFSGHVRKIMNYHRRKPTVRLASPNS